MSARALALLLVAASGCAAGPPGSGPVAIPGRALAGPPREPAAFDEAVGDGEAGLRGLAAPSAVTAATTLEGAASVAPASEVSSAEARCPVGMALVDDRFCIDRWEATILVRDGSSEQAHSSFEPVDDVSSPYRAVTAPGVVPQGYVSGTQAEQACRASGKRLCTASEWERACRGPSGHQFPYGASREARTCNDDVRPTHPVVEAARRMGVPAEQTWTTGMNLPLVNQLPGGLAATGERYACTTPEGVFDMVGNLHEWIADSDGTFRGGFYMDTSQNGEGCAYQTTAHDVGYHDYSTGFRCCAHADDVE